MPRLPGDDKRHGELRKAFSRVVAPGWGNGSILEKALRHCARDVLAIFVGDERVPGPLPGWCDDEWLRGMWDQPLGKGV